MLQALGLTPGLEAAKYAGYDPALALLNAGATVPLLGTNALTQAVANLTGATNSSSTVSKTGLGASLIDAGAKLGSAYLTSDRRVKTDIEKIGELDDGLGVYDFNYLWGGPRQRGVMADEVEKLRPWALGPRTVQGYATVDYSML